MSTRTIITIACAAAVLAGCAGRANSVAPMAIAATDYSGLSCDAARESLQTARDKVAALSRRQNNAALADTAGVVVLFLPLGSIFGGDVSGELSQAKGEQAALERTIQSRCND